MEERERLLTHDGDAAPHQQQRATRAALLVAGIFCLAAIVNMRSAGDSRVSEERGVEVPKQMLPGLVDDDDVGVDIQMNTTVHVFKRTLASLSPGEDAAFVFRYAGLLLNASAQYHCDIFADNTVGEARHINATGKGAKLCAERAVSISADLFEIHFFHSHVSADSTEVASQRAWIQRWNALHHGSEINATTFAKNDDDTGEIHQRKQDGNETSPWDHVTAAHVDGTHQPQSPVPTPTPSSAPGEQTRPTSTYLTFNEFTPQSVTFFTPDLSNFVRVWKKAGIPTMLRQYTSSTSTSGVVYSGRIATPASGFIIEIIAYNVEERFRSSFDPYHDDECGPAMEIHANNLTYWWKKNKYFETGSDLPGLLVAQITQPAQSGDDLTQLGNYLMAATGADLSTTPFPIEYPENNCSSADVWLEVWSANGYAIPVRTIANGATASEGSALSVASFQNEMSAMLDALMGCNKGYSRFVDWHIGIFLQKHGTRIDANGQWLCENKIGFHNGGTNEHRHAPSSVWGWGSNWARGAAGVGIEFFGAYDGTIFDNVTQLDYCSPSGFSSLDARTRGDDYGEEYCDMSVLNDKEKGRATESPANWHSPYSYSYSGGPDRNHSQR